MEKLATISDVLALVKDQRDCDDQARAAEREHRAKEFAAKHELEREAFALEQRKVAAEIVAIQESSAAIVAKLANLDEKTKNIAKQIQEQSVFN